MNTVDPQIVDGLRVLLLLGMAVLAFREFKRIRAQINEKKDAERRRNEEQNGRD
jgi:hypothetical protein